MVPTTGRAGPPVHLHLLLALGLGLGLGLGLAAEGLRRRRTPAAETGSGKAPVRTRRGILQLAGTVYCTTGRTPLAYLRYGCYCGLGGTGWPNDDTDWCCFKHDCCYDKAKEEGCSPKTEGYSWKCKDNEAECDDIEDKCQKLACECDREAATCLAKASYNFRYIFWPVTLCGTVSPQCKED